MEHAQHPCAAIVLALRAEAERARSLTCQAVRAYERLVQRAEHSDTGQARHVARFIASTYDGERFPFDPFSLRALDPPITDDMLQCLDALRWGDADLYRLIRDGDARVRALIEIWGLVPVQSAGD